MSIPSSAQKTRSEPHVPCHHNESQVRLSVPPADWVNQTSLRTNKEGGESHFEFFYNVIFTFVHSALTLLLAPVLKTTRVKKMPRSSSTRSQRTQQSLRDVDPELAMMAPADNRLASSNSSSILKIERRRSSGDRPQYQAASANTAAGASKSVRFPEPKRSRPPLGRISSSIGSVSVNSSTSSTSVSESSSSSSSSSNGRGRIASRYTLSPRPRTHHSTYFLSD
jgi:hypothetical protein